MRADGDRERRERTPVLDARGAPGDARATRAAARIVLALALPGFALIAAAMLGGATEGLDRAALLALRAPHDLADAAGPLWLERAIEAATTLGGRTFLGPAGLLVAGALAFRRRWRDVLFLFVALPGASLLSDGLKALIGRPRPEVVPHLIEVHSLSFPSGHATYSAAAYLAFWLVAARTWPGTGTRRLLGLGAIAIVLVVGFSRVYLGVHHPSDVLAGWCLGAGWVAAAWIVLQRVGPSGGASCAGQAR